MTAAASSKRSEAIFGCSDTRRCWLLLDLHLLSCLAHKQRKVNMLLAVLHTSMLLALCCCRSVLDTCQPEQAPEGNQGSSADCSHVLMAIGSWQACLCRHPQS